MYRKVLLSVSLVLAVCLGGAVSADEEIFIPDAGFDDQVLPAGGYTYIGDGEWAGSLDYPGPWQSAGGDAWIDNGYYVADGDLPAVSGDNKLYGYESTEDYVYQILDETFIKDGIYTLSVQQGSAWSDYDDGWWLYFTGEDYNLNLAEASGNGPVGAWEKVSLVYTAAAADAGKRIGIKLKGDPWVTFDDVTLSYRNPYIAANPSPDSGQSDVLRDADLSWAPSTFAAQRNVYLGESFEDVNTGTVPTASGLDVNSFDPGRLEFGKTYFWRVDEIEDSPAQTVHKGDIWSFEVEPYSIPLPGSSITVTASSAGNEFSLPERTIDGSGLDANDMHATPPETMWVSGTVDLDPWIQYEFDSVKMLDTMKVWNANSAAESAIGWGVKDVIFEYSVDGENWDALAEVSQLSQAPGVGTYDQYDTIDFGGAAAKYLRLDIQSNWGGVLMSYGLSEVQFTTIPAAARYPEPASGSVDVLPQTVVGWRAGRQAAEHIIYVSTNYDEVADGLAPSVASSTNSMDLISLNLQLGETYYWRVDEVNEAEAPSVWTGPVWSFSTPAAMAVDNFERYGNNSPDRPFQTWLDGIGFSGDEFFPAGYGGNGTGAGVGHDIWSLSSPHYNGDIMEKSITLEGSSLSLPFYYDNTGGVASQTDRTWAAPQDWTVGGAQTLVLYFYGGEDNTGGPLFVEVNGQKVTYANSADLSEAVWHQWNIDLASLGTNLNAVTSMSLGVEGAGSGGILIDDMGLYRDAPPISGQMTYSFSDLPAGGDALGGMHLGIDFGSGDWWGGDNWYGTSKCGYFSGDFANSDVSFTLPENATLVSIVVSADGDYSYTISDGVNAEIVGISGTTPEVIETLWTSGGRTITINTEGGWNVVFDDITYMISE